MNRYIYQGLMGIWYIIDTDDDNMVIAMSSHEDKAALICEALNGGNQ
jgi:hypothetical protein